MADQTVDNAELADYTVSGKALSGGQVVQSVELVKSVEGGAKTDLLGSQLSASSIPVVVASDQGAVSVTAAGAVASGSADSGNPVKVAGRYNSTKPTLTDGQRGDLQLDTKGKLGIYLGLADSNSSPVNTSALGEAYTNTPFAIAAQGFAMLCNGTTWDRQRGTSANIVLASGARTTTQTQADATNYNHRGIRVVLDMTVVGTGSVTVSIQGKDANGIYYTLLTGAAVTTNVTNVYEVFPGATAAANAVANSALPRTYRVVVTANNANSATYSVSSELIL